MLEKNTERLHEYTEKNLDLIDRTQVRASAKPVRSHTPERLSAPAVALVDARAAASARI